MARTKEFDPDAALQSALELFWRQGYEATSMADLVGHHGIGRASIYATFGNKHELYLKALDRYNENRDPGLLGELSGPGAGRRRAGAATAGLNVPPAVRGACFWPLNGTIGQKIGGVVIMTTRFTGRTVLVTGAGSGIGRAVALAFAAEGASVAVAGRTAAPLDETVALIGKEGGTAAAFTADVSRSGEVRELVDRTVARFGSLDVAVNNAGVFRGGAPVADLPEEDWRSLVDINLTGVLFSLQAEIARMREQPTGGAIVNLASNLGAHRRVPGLAGYIATKAAVSALTRAAALDHIADGVRVNAVSPGPSATSMSLLPGEDDAARATRMRKDAPLGRVSTTAEIAAAVLYLASPEAASVVGTDLVVVGGAAA